VNWHYKYNHTNHKRYSRLCTNWTKGVPIVQSTSVLPNLVPSPLRLKKQTRGHLNLERVTILDRKVQVVIESSIVGVVVGRRARSDVPGGALSLSVLSLDLL
jgi:carbohydrate-binding DOMON domain-containing protein